MAVSLSFATFVGSSMSLKALWWSKASPPKKNIDAVARWFRKRKHAMHPETSGVKRSLHGVYIWRPHPLTHRPVAHILSTFQLAR